MVRRTRRYSIHTVAQIYKWITFLVFHEKTPNTPAFLREHQRLTISRILYAELERFSSSAVTASVTKDYLLVVCVSCTDKPREQGKVTVNFQMFEPRVCANSSAGVLPSNSELQPSHARERHSRVPRHRSKSRSRRSRADRWVRATNARLAILSVEEMHLGIEDYINAFRAFGEAMHTLCGSSVYILHLAIRPLGHKYPNVTKPKDVYMRRFAKHLLSRKHLNAARSTTTES